MELYTQVYLLKAAALLPVGPIDLCCSVAVHYWLFELVVLFRQSCAGAGKEVRRELWGKLAFTQGDPVSSSWGPWHYTARIWF